jgi:hypothetical protein
MDGVIVRRKLDLCGRVFNVPENILKTSDLISGLIEMDPEFGLGDPYPLDRSPMLFDHVLAYMIDPNGYLYPLECEPEIKYYSLPLTTLPRPDCRGPMGPPGPPGPMGPPGSW